MLAFTTVFWSLSFPLVKGISILQSQLIPGSNSWFHASLTGVVRFGLAGLIMLFVSLRTITRITQCELWQGLGIGFFAAGGILFQMDGLSHTSASVSAFVTQAFCVFVPIIVAVRDRQWPERRVVMSIILMMIGVAILANFDIRTFHLARGEAETLLAAVFFAFQILWLERPVFAKNNVNHFSVVMFLTMALISVPILCGSARHLNDAVVCYKNPAVLAMAGSITLFCTVLAFVLMNRWQPFVPATEAAVIYGAEPVFASILALFLPSFISKWTGIDYQNERITWQLLAGGLLVFLANLVLQIRRRREKTNLTADFAD
jgi:drug/metabolite transporter (DMT)-like permease